MSDDLIAEVTNRFATNTNGERKPRQSSQPYGLRGMLYCAHCGQRMQGAWRASKRKDGTGRTLYRCELAKQRACHLT